MKTPRAFLTGGMLALLLACGGHDSPSSSATDQLSEQVESAHYVYHFAPGDRVDADWQENYHRWLTEALRTDSPQKLQYFKYRDRAHLRLITGRDTNGYADTSGNLVFHTIWSAENHENVHALVLNRMGFPPALFTEGIAVAHSVDLAMGWLDPHWRGEAVHSIAARYRRNGQIPSLDQLLESNAFRQRGDEITYPIAGSFVRFMIDSHGLVPLKALFAASRYDAPGADIRQQFFTAYGTSVDTVWAEWLAFLDAMPPA
jgi:hypothetical protein